MTPRDNMLAVLNREIPESIPHIHMGFWNETAMKTLLPDDCYDDRMNCIISDDPPWDNFPETPRTDDNRQHVVNLGRLMGCACLGVGDGGPMMFGHGGPAEIVPHVIERNEQYKILQYEGGHKRKVNFDPHSIKYFDFPLDTIGDLDKLHLPDMNDPKRYYDIQADADFYRQAGFMPTASIQGLFSGIHNSFMDMEQTLIDLMLEPMAMKQLVKRMTEMNLAACSQVLDRGVEMIEVCDDLGSPEGLLISPSLFEEFFLPSYQQICNLVHQKGGWVHFHSHGNIYEMMPVILKAGFDLMNPFDLLENPDIDLLMKSFGDKIIFVGGYNTESNNWPIEKQISHMQESLERGKTLCQHGYVFMDPGFHAGMGKDRFLNIMHAINSQICKL